MSGFTRRYLTDPGQDELTAIEGVVILDREPAGAVNGVGTGVVLCVGEFEDGPFATPYEVTSGDDFATTFGGFGFTYDGVVACNPCARSRKADNALKPEYWNGNGWVSIARKRFARLVLSRVDTTVGEVSFSRLAYLDGTTDFSWDLAPGATLNVEIDSVADVATFAATVAKQTSSAGTYPITLSGGESMTLVTDAGTPYQVGPVTVVFATTDDTHAEVVARINAAMGYTAAAIGATGVTEISGRLAGTSGTVTVSAITSSLATATGISVGTATGGGDASNIDAVTFAEVKAVLERDLTNVRVERSETNALRLVSKTASTGKVKVLIATTATALGFPIGVESTVLSHAVDGVIPAGTRVQTAGGAEWVVARSIEALATSAGPFVARVRPANDDGTAVAANPGTITVVPAPVAGMGSFAVTNNLVVSAALTEAQIDAAYQAALDATLNPNSVAKESTILFTARASNAVRSAERANVIAASAHGLAGRRACIRPALGTSRTVAKSTTGQPGVGAYRSDRVFYAYPGASTYISAIAVRGTAGGAGFTADGYIDVGSDSWLASICSQLPPEENPAQETDFALNVASVERGNADVQSMTEDDYRAFKRLGICALRIDEGVAGFQSGVTSVDRALHPGLVNIARRQMADYIQDSLARRLKPFAKKLATPRQRATVLGQIDTFLSGLQSDERIDSYRLDAKTPNTPEKLAAGLFRVQVKVRTISSMDEIVLDTEIGESVVTVNAA